MSAYVRKEYQKITIIIPIVAYNLLTMLLLCGPSHRYFYFNSVLILPIVLILLHDDIVCIRCNYKENQQHLDI